MMKNRVRVGVGAGIGIVAVSVAVPAFAESTQTIVEGLQNSNVYTSYGVDKVPTGLNSAYQNSNIAVVFLDESGINTKQKANEVLQALSQTDANVETVIVSVNGRSFGVASDNGEAAAMETLLNTEGEEALVSQASTIQEMASGTGLITSTETGTNTPGVDSGMSLVAGIGLGAGVLIAGLIVAVVLKSLFKGKKRSTVSIGGNGTPVSSAKLRPQEYFNKISSDLGKRVAELRVLTGKHERAGMQDSAIVLLKVDERLGELFYRLKKKGTNDQLMTASVTYEDLLKKLLYIMDEDHYMDVVAHPDLWNNPAVKKEQSLDAVQAVEEQIVKNIKRLNDSQELDFTITIQALTAGNNDLGTIDEMLFGDDEDEISFKNFGK